MKNKKPGGAFVIADSQFLITEALKSMLVAYGAKVYTASGKKGLHELLRKYRVSLVIADHTQLYHGAMDELSRLKKQYPETAHLVLSGTISKQKIKELNHAGIRNIALKTDDRTEIVLAVKAALKGEKHYSREVLDLLLDTDAKTVEALLLTPSESELFHLISSGLSIQEIACRKNVGVRSVMSHSRNMFRKLGVSNSRELTEFALRTGLFDNIEYYI
jgi:DNA-binding NarL/FixJ family response regulator